MYKVVFFDIDGTLLNWRGELPRSTKAAVSSLRNNGVVPVIASARPPFNIYELMNELEISSYVAFNGSFVVYEHQVIHQSAVLKPSVDEIRKSVLEQGDSVILATAAGFQIMSETPEELLEYYLRKWDIRKRCQAECAADILQLEVFCSPASIQGYTDKHNLTFYPWGSKDDAFNVVNFGVSKASGIQKLLDLIGLTNHDAAAFGDGINDIEMLTSAGFGVAMGNAVEELKATADLVTRHVDEDGVWYGLKELGLI